MSLNIITMTDGGLEVRCGYCHKKIAVPLNRDVQLTCPHCKFYWGIVKVTVGDKPGEVDLEIDTEEESHD